MIALASDLRVWLWGGATSLRRGLYGLGLQVQEGLGRDPFAGELSEPVIPPRSHRKHQRPYDRDLYKARHLVENAFLKLKQWRAVATR